MPLLRMPVALAALVASSVFTDIDFTEVPVQSTPRELRQEGELRGAFDGHMLTRLMLCGQRWRTYALAATV